jgi:hypothetical protein
VAVTVITVGGSNQATAQRHSEEGLSGRDHARYLRIRSKRICKLDGKTCGSFQ